jgi:lysophospholipase L1-like esterase
MTMWTRFAALGDSITEGYGMDRVEGVEHLPWAERVARGLGVELHNLGWRNLRARQIADSQIGPALALEPDLVSIAAGCNDMLDETFSHEQVERDLEPLYAAFAETGATVFTFTYMNLPGSGVLPPEGAAWISARMQTLHDAVTTLAARYGAIVMDLYADPGSANPAFWSADLQHANALGQRYVAERVLEALAEQVLVAGPDKGGGARAVMVEDEAL